MHLFVSPSDRLVSAIEAHQNSLQFDTASFVSADAVFKKAMQKEPRLLAYLESYEGNYMTQGIRRSYQIMIKYAPDAPSSVSDVILDNGSWTPAGLCGKASPFPFRMVTKAPDRIEKLLKQELDRWIASYEGFLGYQLSCMQFEKISEYYLLHVNYDYILEIPQISAMRTSAETQARAVWKQILGNAEIAQFALPFLAFSYLTQECAYDQRAFDEVADNPHQKPTDPVPSLSYGPLVQKRGICAGFAWAFKRMMDVKGIPCRCVTGYLKEDKSVGHIWNLVQLNDGSWQHVDATTGIHLDGVDVSCFMLTDNQMKATHEWDTALYPVPARGVNGTYDRVELYFSRNGAKFLSDGAQKKYMFPDNIYE
ncbi:MAG: hypothetical protein IJJ69_11655 [Oscillospiraceae bacterium]|nr:hypothetical protein [Oscillospiraceae bacterium]